jgi:hypothetical protein
MSLVKKILPLVAVGALALGITTSCGSKNGGLMDSEENKGPTMNAIPNFEVNEREKKSYQIEASDPEGDPLTFSLEGFPSWVSVSETGLFSLDAPSEDIDNLYFGKVKVASGQYAETQDVSIKVKDLETRAAITKAADRLILLQNANGSWDWIVTDKTGPTATTYLNIAGVDGDILLDAFRITNDSKYLDSAKRTGNHIITELDKLPEARHFNAFNMTFLKDLAGASGDSTYSNYVAKKMNDLKTKVTYWGSGAKNISTDGIPGLTAEELVAAEEVIRGTANNGIKPWDLYKFVGLAKDSGDNDYATKVATGIKNYLDRAGYGDTTNDYILGLAAGVIGLSDAGMSYGDYLNTLIGKQFPDGHFETPDSDYTMSLIASTGYSLMALKKAGRISEAINSSKYLTGSQRADGGWLEGNGKEYSETTSEAGHGIAKLLQ